MAYNPNNPNGQSTMANSQPVTIASDQSLIPVENRFSYSTVNTSAVQLTSGQTFTGAIEAIPNASTYSLLVFSDQPSTIIINQFMDLLGTQLTIQQTYSYVANDRFAISYPTNGDFIQVIVTNNGPSTTTKFKAEIAFGYIQSSNRLGNLPVSISDVGGVSYALSNKPNTGGDNGMPVRLVPQSIFRTTFSKVVASGVDTNYFNIIQSIGAGQTIAQSGGNLVITTGTTVNSETIARSTSTITGSFLLRASSILSQRIVNNQFFIELVDVIGDNLAITVNSATSVTITIPNNTFDSSNVGQSIFIGKPTGFTGVTAVSGRYAIASVSGNNVTFTVAGWATGSVNTGTCSLFGWNYHQVLYDSTVATNAKYDAQRRGWNNGYTTATISTTAGVGHMVIIGSEDGDAFMADQLTASSTTLPVTVRASRVTNLAEENTILYLQIRTVNGTTAPASTTTWTIGSISLENYAAQAVNISNVKAQGRNNAQPIIVSNTPAVTINSGTVTSVTTLANGQTAHSAASTGSPIRIGGRVLPTTIATADATLVAGDASDAGITTGQQIAVKAFSTAELDYSFNMSTVSTVTSLQPLVLASGTASIRNYITSIILQSDTLGAAGNVWILDGQGAIGTSVTIATPGVFTSSAHDLKIGDAIVFTSLGTITGVSTNTIYWVTATSFAATTFTLSTTYGGTAIAITGSTSAFTFYRVLYPIRMQTTSLAPTTITFPTPLRTMANVAANLLIPSSLTSGSIYVLTNGYRGF